MLILPFQANIQPVVLAQLRKHPYANPIRFSQNNPQRSLYYELTDTLYNSIEQDNSLPFAARFQLQKQKIVVPLWRGLAKTVNFMLFNYRYLGLNPDYLPTLQYSLSRFMTGVLMDMNHLAHEDGFNGSSRPYAPQIEVLKSPQNQILFQNPNTGRMVALQEMIDRSLNWEEQIPNAVQQVISKHMVKIMTPENLHKAFQHLRFALVPEASTPEKTVYRKNYTQL